MAFLRSTEGCLVLAAVGACVLTLLMSLRGLIAILAALFVWYVLQQTLGVVSMVTLLVPVWLGGVCGGVVCASYSRRHAVVMGLICGSALAVGFLFTRWSAGVAFDSLLAFWPLWFPPSFYVGCVIYLQLSALAGNIRR